MMLVASSRSKNISMRIIGIICIIMKLFIIAGLLYLANYDGNVSILIIVFAFFMIIYIMELINDDDIDDNI